MSAFSTFLVLLVCIFIIVLPVTVSGQSWTTCSNGIRVNGTDNSTVQGTRSSTASTLVILPNGVQFIVSVSGQVGVFSYTFSRIVTTYGFPNSTYGWVRQNVTGLEPPARRGAAAAADSQGNLYLIGGTQWDGNPPTTLYNDVWMHVYNPANGVQYAHTWTMLDISAPFAGRYNAAFLLLNNPTGLPTMLISGGSYTWQGMGAYSDMWRRENGTWTQLNVDSVNAFQNRQLHTMVWFKGAIYSIGGQQDGDGAGNPASTGSQQIWTSTTRGATWTQLRPNLPFWGPGPYGAWVQPATNTTEETLTLTFLYGKGFASMRTTDRNLSVWNTTFTSVNLTTLSAGRWVPYYDKMVYLHGYYYNSTAASTGACSSGACYDYPFSSVFLDISFQGAENGCITTNPTPSTPSSSSTGGSGGGATGGSVSSSGSQSGGSSSTGPGPDVPGGNATANTVSILVVMLSIALSFFSSV